MPALPKHDPLNRPATKEEIQNLLLKFEQSPIDVGGFLIDCDARSERLMSEALSTWNFRPVEPGWFEDINVAGDISRVIYWKLADNKKHPFSLEELTGIFSEMKFARTIRSQSLWAACQRFKTAGVNLRYAQDIENWLS